MSDTLTIDDIMKAHDEVMKYAPKQHDNPFAFNPMSFGGMPVFEARDQVVPKIQVSESFARKWLTDEARDRINAKLVDMLGVNVFSPVPKGVMYKFGNNIIARPEHVAALIDLGA